jgi:hypothetical protein
VPVPQTRFLTAIGILFAGILLPSVIGFDGAWAKVDLRGRASQTARYFLEDQRLRHQITEVSLRQVADIREGMTTVVEGRFLYDSALFPTPSIQFRHYSKEVRNDEGFEAEARQIYVDWLSEKWAIKVGRIQFDWMDSLSPRTSDAVTALDLRHGGFDNPSQIIEPVEAISANTSVGFGSAEFMIVPRGKHHRLPKGENGYGYVERVNGLLGGVQQALVASGVRRVINPALISGQIPIDTTHAEYGGRYLMSASGIDFSAFAWRGHQRTPSLELTFDEAEGSSFDTEIWDLKATEKYPQMSSYGVFASLGGEASVFRLFSLYEPGRTPSVLLQDELAKYLSPALGNSPSFLGDRVYRSGSIEDRLRGGLGFDYVFSKHLKIYSEGYVTVSQVKGRTPAGDSVEETLRDHTATMRLTNESFDDLFISCDTTITGPKRSWLISPDVTFEWRDKQPSANTWKLSVGGWLVQSESEQSALQILRGARQVYMRLGAWF